MFGNLKNKLGEVTDLKKFASPQLVTSHGSSRQRSAQHTPGTQTPNKSQHSRQISNASQEAYSSMINGSEVSQKPFGPKDGELQQKVLTLQKQIEEIQKVKDEAHRVKEEQWKKKVKVEQDKVLNLEQTVSALFSKEKQLSKKLNQNEKDSNEKVQHEATIKGMEKKIVNMQDDYDQMEGLGAQELAKVKHLLLSATSEIQSKDELLIKATNSLKEARTQLSLCSDQTERISFLSEEKMELETLVAGLKQKLNSTNLKLTMQDKENQENIKNLDEKINILTSRQQQNGMEESERVQSLLQEREALEHKLEERRQELNNVKLSWSEKISMLENQIGNLNEKIVEDQYELKTMEELIEKLQLELVEDRKDKQQLQLEINNSDQKNEKSLRVLTEDLDTVQWQLQELEKKREQELKDLRKQLHIRDEQIAQHKESLSLLEQQSVLKKDNYQQSIDELEALTVKYDELNTAHTMLQSAYQNFCDSLREQTVQKQKLEDELSVLTSKFDVVSSEKAKLSDNLDSYVDKLTQLQSELTFVKEESELRKCNVEQLESQLIDTRNNHELLLNKMKDTEKLFEETVRSSEPFKSLQAALADLEDKLTEKQTVIKMQNQRLNDMKKTLQRELKITDCLPESLPSTQDLAYSRPKLNQSPSKDSNGDFIDPVNLSYLRHVLMKFMTSREYESVQLIRAIGTLLQLTEAEENLIRETLTWKMSWFGGSRPNHGRGQQAKSIPPS